jgi:hypothetical protein
MTIPFGTNQAMNRFGGVVLAGAALAFRDQSAEGRNGNIIVTPAPVRKSRRDLLTPMLM